MRLHNLEQSFKGIDAWKQLFKGASWGGEGTKMSKLMPATKNCPTGASQKEKKEKGKLLRAYDRNFAPPLRG